MVSPEDQPAPHPQKVNARLIQESREELARFISEIPQLNADVGEEKDDWERITHLIRIDNSALGRFVEEMALSTSDLDARRLIAGTALIIYQTMCKALDPERRIETEGD